jgi:ribosomal-protein-alanine N-acetyltransferase
MSEPWSIRAMRATDLPAVMRIEMSSYSMPWSEQTFRSLLRRADADMLIVEAAEQVIGYSASWYVLDQAELGNVAVSAEWRRNGVGARLIEIVLTRAAERGVREVFLEVRPSNEDAQRLYQRFGFRTVGRRKNYYLQPAEDAIVMRRTVERASSRT